MNNFEEYKIWKADGETRRLESVVDQLHAIREEGGRVVISGRRFRKISEMMGIKAHFQNNRRPTLTKRRWGMSRWGGGEEVIIDDFEEVVGEERPEIMEEQVQMVRKQDMDEERNVLSAMALIWELILDKCQVKFMGNKTRAQLQRWRF